MNFLNIQQNYLNAGHIVLIGLMIMLIWSSSNSQSRAGDSMISVDMGDRYISSRNTPGSINIPQEFADLESFKVSKILISSCRTSPTEFQFSFGLGACYSDYLEATEIQVFDKNRIISYSEDVEFTCVLIFENKLLYGAHHLNDGKLDPDEHRAKCKHFVIEFKRDVDVSLVRIYHSYYNPYFEKNVYFLNDKNQVIRSAFGLNFMQIRSKLQNTNIQLYDDIRADQMEALSWNTFTIANKMHYALLFGNVTQIYNASTYLLIAKDFPLDQIGNSREYTVNSAPRNSYGHYGQSGACIWYCDYYSDSIVQYELTCNYDVIQRSSSAETISNFYDSQGRKCYRVNKIQFE